MSKNRFFVYCCSGLGREVIGTVARSNEVDKIWDEIRFIDDNQNMEKVINGFEVWTFEDYINSGILKTDRFVIAAGEPLTRASIHNKLIKNNLKLGIVIDPINIYQSSAEIGEGTIIQQQAGPGPNCRIGKCVLLQGHVVMGHDVEIGDYSTISSLVFIGGDTKIGLNTYIAPGALIRNGIVIGDNCIIGMGSVVTKSIPDNSVAYGNPCKVVRENTEQIVFVKK
ncbi:MAG: DapH/DapD/GlmU-related protein [Lutibacter sp.]|jgi:sugar O-acyltransferase (sialic acid O-acetyltransferase NeuD family)